MNTLYTNDNLFVLYGLNSECVDLIYLDPPFNSKRTYSAPVGSKAAGSSFKDMWTWQDVDEACLDKLVENYPALVDFINSIEKIHSKAMKAYIAYMTQRMIELHRILKDTGSIYLHCDPTASHYLKILLDEIFGKNNFMNEIVWSYQTGGISKKWFGRKHDIILFYAKNKDNNIIDLIQVKEKRSQEVLRRLATGNESATRAKDSERLPFDVWQIPALNAMAKERTGYPTQKPLALLERIIKASSKEGDLVLDPFCGCATTCVASEMFGRKWIGIDIEEQAVKILTERLSHAGGLDGLEENAENMNFKYINVFKNPKLNPQRTDVEIELITNKTVRERLFKLQNERCKACDVEMRIVDFEVDHIVPKAKGGGDYFENYQLLCGSCNKIKGARPMEYLRLKIKTREKYIEKVEFGE